MTDQHATDKQRGIWRTIVEWSKDIWPVTRLALLVCGGAVWLWTWVNATPGLGNALVGLAFVVVSTLFGLWSIRKQNYHTMDVAELMLVLAGIGFLSGVKEYQTQSFAVEVVASITALLCLTGFVLAMVIHFAARDHLENRIATLEKTLVALVLALHVRFNLSGPPHNDVPHQTSPDEGENTPAITNGVQE